MFPLSVAGIYYVITRIITVVQTKLNHDMSVGLFWQTLCHFRESGSLAELSNLVPASLWVRINPHQWMELMYKFLIYCNGQQKMLDV